MSKYKYARIVKYRPGFRVDVADGGEKAGWTETDDVSEGLLAADDHVVLVKVRGGWQPASYWLRLHMTPEAFIDELFAEARTSAKAQRERREQREREAAKAEAERLRAAAKANAEAAAEAEKRAKELEGTKV